MMNLAPPPRRIMAWMASTGFLATASITWYLMVLFQNGGAEALQGTSTTTTTLALSARNVGSLFPPQNTNILRLLLGHHQRRHPLSSHQYYDHSSGSSTLWSCCCRRRRRPRRSRLSSLRSRTLHMVVGNLATQQRQQQQPNNEELSLPTAISSSTVGGVESVVPRPPPASQHLDSDRSSSSTTTGSTIMILPVDDSTATSTSSTLTLWQRRLVTSEDPWSIHKWSSLVYTVTSLVILGTGATNWISDVVLGTTTSATTTAAAAVALPDSLAPYAVAFSLSNVVMCLASVRMSFQHRQGDITARNAFLGTAVSSLFSGFFFLWVSPFAPTLFDNHTISRGCFALLLLLNTVFIVDTLVKVPQVVEGRRDRKVELSTTMEQQPVLFWRDAMGYVLPIAWGLPVIGATGYQAALVHDRQWFLTYCYTIQTTTGFPFLVSTAYLQVLASLAASYGALFVTLRDKKLITKRQELVGITIFSVPAMIWTIYVTVIFYQGFATISS